MHMKNSIDFVTYEKKQLILTYENLTYEF